MTLMTTYEKLAIVRLRGFEGEPDYEGQVDAPGSANLFCERYGMAPEPTIGEAYNPQVSGIIWTDYDCGDAWDFSVLIDAAEVDDLRATAEGTGYEVLSIDEVDEPIHYGDGHSGTVTVCRHPEGWIVVN